MNTLIALTALSAASTALALSDGTPVEFVKITSKDNIQVRVPSTHDLGAADELRIFRRDGSHYKNETDLKLVVAAPAPAAAAPTPTAPAAGANDNVTYVVEGNSFGTFDEAKAEAIDLFQDYGNDVEIMAVTTKVIGRVGFTAIAA